MLVRSGFDDTGFTSMVRLYRIELDVFLDDRMRSRVIQAARDLYNNSEGAWTEEGAQTIKITAEEFVPDTRAAFLELTHSALRAAVPEIEPHIFRCSIENSRRQPKPRPEDIAG